MLIDIDQQLVFRRRSLTPDVALIEGNQIERFLRQSIVTECQRLGVSKVTVHLLDPAAFPANVPRCAQVPRAILEFNRDPIAGFELV